MSTKTRICLGFLLIFVIELPVLIYLVPWFRSMALKWSLEAAGQYEFAGMVAGSAFGAIALLVGAVSLVSISADTKRFRRWREAGYMWFWAGAVVLCVLHFGAAFIFGLAMFFIQAPSADAVNLSVLLLASGAISLLLVAMPMVALALRSDSDLY